MNLKCIFGYHQWSQRQCVRCGKREPVTPAHLIHAVVYGNIRAVQALLDEGANPNAAALYEHKPRNRPGDDLIEGQSMRTALEAALLQEQLDMARELVRRGARLSASSDRGKTVVDVVLLNAVCSVNSSDKRLLKRDKELRDFVRSDAGVDYRIMEESSTFLANSLTKLSGR